MLQQRLSEKPVAIDEKVPSFLLVGAGTSIGAVAGMLTIVRWRVAAVVTVTLWITAILFGSVYNLLLAARVF